MKKNELEIEWHRNLAYCVGLLVSDGNLSKDKRHIVFVSKDLNLVEKFKSCLNLKNKIAYKASGFNRNGKYYYVQFGNVKLYRWLNKIGIKSCKSKTVGPLSVPNKYFFDFIRGLFDGDGCITSFNHPECRKPQIRIKFASSSEKFLIWIRKKIDSLIRSKGNIETIPRAFELVYYKGDSVRLLRNIYRNPGFYLNRKFERANFLLNKNEGGWCNWQTREA